MLIIREPQIAAFRQDAYDRFENSMVRSIAIDYPPKFEYLGEERIRKLIRKAIESGSAHGITNEGAVAVWIEMIVQFGEGFQMSPEKAWAQKILAHPKLPDYIRMELIRERLTARTGGRTLMPTQAPDP